MSARVVGVDGCKGGWFAVWRDQLTGEIESRLAAKVQDLLASDAVFDVLAIDIPIGLLDGAEPGGRPCDRAARDRIGRRRSSVFSPPVRAALHADSYPEALRRNRASSAHRLGISRQCDAIRRKIAEVDTLLRETVPRVRVVEVHPEVSFTELGGAPMRHSKRQTAGHEERLALLEQAWGRPLASVVGAARAAHGGHVAADDVLDAMVACWTAERVARGSARSFPATPAVDAVGLQMVILA